MSPGDGGPTARKVVVGTLLGPAPEAFQKAAVDVRHDAKVIFLRLLSHVSTSVIQIKTPGAVELLPIAIKFLKV